MARPSTTRDITIENVEFGSIDLVKIATDAAILKGYTAFIEAITKSGATVEMTPYHGVRLSRVPNQDEMAEQLRRAQQHWDEAKHNYETLAAVGEVEYSFQRDAAEAWAKNEGMPFPPEHDPITHIDAVLSEEVDA